jgi:hypothetical protein
MTIKNNSLGDILNTAKNKQTTPEEEKNEPEKGDPTLDFLNSIIVLAVFLIKSFVFGYALKILLHNDWKFFGIICMGLAINFLFQYFYGIIHKN